MYWSNIIFTLRKKQLMLHDIKVFLKYICCICFSKKIFIKDFMLVCKITINLRFTCGSSFEKYHV